MTSPTNNVEICYYTLDGKKHTYEYKVDKRKKINKRALYKRLITDRIKSMTEDELLHLVNTLDINILDYIDDPHSPNHL